MKICDIYPYLYAYLEMLDYARLEDDQYSRQIFDYLKQINVDPPEDQEVRSRSKAKFRSIYASNKKSEDLGQKVSRNLFNQKTASNERQERQAEVANIVRTVKNATPKSGQTGAFNFLTNGCSSTPGSLKSGAASRNLSRSLSNKLSSNRPRNGLEDSAKAASNGESSKKVARKELPKSFEDDSLVDASTGDSLDDLSTNNSSLDVLSSEANDSVHVNGWSGNDFSRRKAAKLPSEELKNSSRKPRKRAQEDDDVQRAEIKALIKEFKYRESIRKAKRRRLIRRESMRFEVE